MQFKLRVYKPAKNKQNAKQQMKLPGKSYVEKNK